MKVRPDRCPHVLGQNPEVFGHTGWQETGPHSLIDPVITHMISQSQVQPQSDNFNSQSIPQVQFGIDFLAFSTYNRAVI